MKRVSISLLFTAFVVICLLSMCNKAATQNRTVKTPMRDGTGLATDLWFPNGGDGPWPVILVRTPYSRENQKGYGRYFSSHNYVVAIQDVRGQYGSEGTFDLWNNEKQDGYDAIEWLAVQEWSKGKVGMVGGSYAAYVQLAAAVERPPHLLTIIPLVTMADPGLNHVYPNGILHLTQHLQAISLFEVNYGKGGSKYRLKPGWQSQLNKLPVIDFDIMLFGEKNQQWRDHLSHKPADSYWNSSNILADLEKTDIPVFLIGGWYDFGGIGTKESYLHLSKSKNPNIKLLLGPWSHQNLGKSNLGPYDFGESARVNIFNKELEWFDFWLKNIKNDITSDSLVYIFAVGPNEWIESNAYPLPQSEILQLFLCKNNQTQNNKNNGNE